MFKSLFEWFKDQVLSARGYTSYLLDTSAKTIAPGCHGVWDIEAGGLTFCVDCRDLPVVGHHAEGDTASIYHFDSWEEWDEWHSADESISHEKNRLIGWWGWENGQLVEWC